MKTTKKLIKKHIPTKEGRTAAKLVFNKTVNDPANIVCEFAILCMGRLDPGDLVRETGIYPYNDMTDLQKTRLNALLKSRIQLISQTKKGMELIAAAKAEKGGWGEHNVDVLLTEYRKAICRQEWERTFQHDCWFAEDVWNVMKERNSGNQPDLAAYMKTYRAISEHLPWKKKIDRDDIRTAMTILTN